MKPLAEWLVDPADPDPAAISAAAAILRDGGLVAFPTETVYGLGADARNDVAIHRVYQAKGRPSDNPLIVHVHHVDAAARVAELTPLARRLAQEFWPGPLTLVLRAAPGLAAAARAGLDTVAVRVPAHPVALALLGAADVPVAAPSANRSGRPSPTTAAHVRDDLAERIDGLLDGGACRLGLESTVVDARGDVPVVLREGAVTREALGVAAGTHQGGGESAGPALLAASPGTRHAHYQPDCEVVLAAIGDGVHTAQILRGRGRAVGLISPQSAPDGVVEIGRSHSAELLAQELYGWLRAAEAADIDVLVVEAVPAEGIGRAVMDRLRRAAGR